MTRTIAVTEWAGPSFFRMVHQHGANVLVVKEGTLLKDFDKCAGLIVPGGRDVGTGWYDEDPHPFTQAADYDRDAMELALIKRALNKDMPILGVCRGNQLLNVALGGSLIQHLHKHKDYSHTVVIDNCSKLLTGLPPVIKVNSLHHQAVNKLGEGLKVVAKAADGTVEAIESVNHRFALGVQFHPEMSLNRTFEHQMAQIVERFVNAR